jgi:hypothetical protein
LAQWMIFISMTKTLNMQLGMIGLGDEAAA